MEELLLKAVANIGVPAVLCLYVLFGVNKSLKDLTAAIREQTKVFDNIPHRLERVEDSIKEMRYKLEANHHDGDKHY